MSRSTRESARDRWGLVRVITDAVTPRGVLTVITYKELRHRYAAFGIVLLTRAVFPDSSQYVLAHNPNSRHNRRYSLIRLRADGQEFYEIDRYLTETSAREDFERRVEQKMEVV